MSTQDPPQQPSYNELRAAGQPVRLSPEARRLFWALDQPSLASSIRIMREPHDPDHLGALFDDNGAVLDPAFARAPLTEPGVSSVTVRADDVESWEDRWLEAHQDHSDPPEEEDGEGEAGAGGAMVRWGELPDYDADVDGDDGPPFLLACCGTERPRGRAAREVVVRPSSSSTLDSSSGGKGERNEGDNFVTVLDYVSAVHPWLLGQRADLLGALGLWDDEPLQAETTMLMVDCRDAHLVKVCLRDVWVARERKRGPGGATQPTVVQYF